MENIQEENEIKKRIENRIAKKNLSEKLYHYTTIGALFDILSNRELWLSNARNVNDKKDCLVFIDAISALLKEESPEYADKIDKELIIIKENFKFPYLFCLSGKPDDAGMWERYADNANGVCLEFDTRSIFKRFWWRAFLEPVLYAFPTNEHYGYKFFKDYIGERNELKHFLNEKDLFSYLKVSGYIFKHVSFVSEDEFRVIMDESMFDMNVKIECKKTKEKINEVMIVDLEGNKVTTENLITGITIGPRSQQNLEDLRSFLKKLGLIKLADNIRKSSCPLR